MEIMKELVLIQQSLKAPKDKRNSFGNYNYRSAEGILEAVKPLLAQHKVQLTLEDEVVPMGSYPVYNEEWQGKSLVKRELAGLCPQNYVKATARLVNESGVSVSASAWAREDKGLKGMSESQMTGATSSYARKYALNALFCIDDSKDIDEASMMPQQPVQVETPFLKQAMAEVDACRTADEVKAVYAKYSTLQKNAEFKSKVVETGKKLKEAK